jgi:hypothetical protein
LTSWPFAAFQTSKRYRLTPAIGSVRRVTLRGARSPVRG